MSAYERRKGKHFENEVCALLREQLGQAVRRNLAQSRSGAVEGGDIVIGKFSIECKRRAAFVGHDWLEQAARDAGDKVAVVVTRADGCEPIALLALADLIPLIRGEL